MVISVVIDKLGSLNEMKIKDFSYENLYKKCKFKKSEGFEKRTTWNNISDSNNYSGANSPTLNITYAVNNF